MPLVEAGHDQRSEQSDIGPTQRPLGIPSQRQRVSPGAEQEDAEDPVPEKMAGLPDVVMPYLKLRMIQSKNKVQDGIKESAGIGCGKIGRRFNGDNNQPENSGDPGFYEVIPVPAQESRSLIVIGTTAGAVHPRVKRPCVGDGYSIA